MIDGTWWLVILIAVIMALWLLAKSRGTKTLDNNNNKSLASVNIPSNDALNKTLKLVKQHFPDYRVSRKGNHLLLAKQGVKIAMITIDKKVAVGERHLGEVLVINYHRVPSRAQLGINLQDAG